MSSNGKDERIHSSQKEAMTSLPRKQESTQSSNKGQNEEDSKKQLGNRKSPNHLPAVDKILNMKDQMESCWKLLKFVADSKLTLTQVNGQRKLGPPPGWTGPPPGPKCEIFVGSIPRNYYEPEIVLIFSTVGQIYELRLMMDFSGTNRGYCFIMYTTEEEAARAVKELDQYEIYPGKKIGVVASTNNCRLYIKQLPQNMDSVTIIKLFYEITDDVDKVAIYRNLNGLICYALISYKTHRGAAMGRRRLVPESATLFKNCEISVEWANPNMAPFNMYEENGTCDDHGHVEVTKTFIEPVKIKKSVARTKHSRSVEKRSNATSNHRAQKPIDPTIRKGRAIKAAADNPSKCLERPPSQCALESYKFQNLVCSQCSQLNFARNIYKTKGSCNQVWDINGNLRSTFNHSLLNVKMNQPQQDQSNAILPSISAYLNKGKRQKSSKWNDFQKSSGEDPRRRNGLQILPNNLPEDSYGSFNKYIADCSCRFPDDGNLNLEKYSDAHSINRGDWTSVQGLTSKFSEGLTVTNENFDKNSAVYTSELQTPLKTNVDLSNSFFDPQPLSDSNRQFSSAFQYENYYQNFAANGAGRKDAMACAPGQHNWQGVRGPVFRQEPSRELFSQRFVPNAMKPVVVDQNFGWCVAGSSPNQPLSYEARKIPELSNGIPSDVKYSSHHQMMNPQNVPEIGRYDDRVNHGSFWNPLWNFDDRLRENSAKAALYSNDPGLVESKLQLGENFQGDGKFYARPVLKGANANSNVNY